MHFTESAPQRAISSDWHRLSASFSVRFSFEDDAFDAQWLPRLPTSREMKRLLVPYRLARDAFMQAFAAQRGASVVILEAHL